ncbi:MAG: 16S rRNA (guanine(966)-N(2))-methyltransferase RsmD [Myxococcales bacterium]|nr:16S rRNA (guanine(966)-N(2))-methyltransferase RsmD [Myxococcales bacterium]
MRITGGRAVRRRIATPKGDTTRPTTDFMRETLFNLLETRAPIARFLDLYAGSGAVGLDAWSRGSESVTLVESDRAALDVIRANILHLGAGEAVEVVALPVERALGRLANKRERYTLVFLDPPYGADAVETTLASLSELRLDDDEGLIVVQHASRVHLAETVGSLRRFEVRRYGNSSYTFYRREVPA